MRNTSIRPILLAAALAAVLTTPALAQVAVPRYPGGGYGGYDNGNWAQVARDYGYRDGLTDGERDARDGRRYSIESHSAYRNADNGYSRARVNREDYRNQFRAAYAQGYREGYQRSARSGYGYPGSGAYGYPGYPNNYPAYPNGYPGTYGYPGNGYPGGYVNNPAYQNGFNDGYREGLDQGRDRDRYDPTGEKRYRSGDHGYDRRYGSKDVYKDQYRDGFRAGYDRGYREAGGGVYNNNRRGWPW